MSNETNETETEDATPGIEWPSPPPQRTHPPSELPPRHENTSLQSQSGSIPSVIRGWYAPPAPWQVQSNSPATPATPKTSQTAGQAAGQTANLTPSQIAGQTPIQIADQTPRQTVAQTPNKISRASPLSTEDDLELLRIAIYYKDRFTNMKGNAALYEAIAEIWRANTGRNISHQTVHKHVTDRLKEHAAILAIPEAGRARMNATETAIFDYANEIYEVLQHNLVAEERRKELASAGTKPQTNTDSVRDDVADELVQRARDKRPRNPANSSQEENERPTARPRTRPPSPPADSPSLHTEMALFLSMMNSRAASEASTAAKRSDITRLERRIDSMAATMDGMMGLLRTLVQRQPRSN
ncbi:hypothetical protein N7517_000449 [Penicillium concentricum]|uniref:Uncharacterized protein n=1 Tax=Penicillium concentricum TaxID=293559 RepID=A0A9W9VHL4_9EURO|nr:uncharacterized protein N7517_000449 [Penicillium concentricum]KAJ5382538.1 hypothetical protein N7517_000449 [Penicillium concentricum]